MSTESADEVSQLEHSAQPLPSPKFHRIDS